MNERAIYKIEIETGGAAFEGGGDEVARILCELAGKIERWGVIADCPLHDINGNRVGKATVGY